MRVFLSILLLFAIWRVFLFLPIVVGNNALSFRKGYEYTRLKYYNYLSNKDLVNNLLISPWANFDGVAYLGIAGNGYTIGNARFFPLYPLLIQGAVYLLGGAKPFDLEQFIIAFFLSNVFFILSLVVFYKLILFDFSKRVAWWSLFCLLMFPTSFFFVSIYTESLFLLLALLSFYFARKKLWLLASMCGILLTTTRVVGIVIFPILLWEFFIQEGITRKSIKKQWKKIILKLIPILTVPFGLISFMFFNFFKWSDFLFFFHQQGNVKNGRSIDTAVFIPQTIFRYVKILLTVSPRSHFEWYIALLEFSVFLFGCLFLFLAWKQKIRITYVLFSLFCFLVPTLSGTFTGLPRYVLVMFPIFISLALLKNKAFTIVYCVTSIIILFLALMFFSKGFFIA